MDNSSMPTFSALTYVRWSLRACPQTQLDGRYYYGVPECLLPLLMPSHKQCFHFLSVLTDTQFQITQPRCNVLSRIFVSMCRVTANSTTKRLLIGSVFSVHVMAH